MWKIHIVKPKVFIKKKKYIYIYISKIIIDN